LAGVFSVSANAPNRLPSQCVAAVFDKGVLLTSGHALPTDLYNHVRDVPSPTEIDLVYMKLQPGKPVYDHVTFLYRGQNAFKTVKRPERASTAILAASEGQSVFLKASALAYVDEYSSKIHGRPWIIYAKLMPDACAEDCSAAMANADFRHLQMRRNLTVVEPQVRGRPDDDIVYLGATRKRQPEMEVRPTAPAPTSAVDHTTRPPAPTMASCAAIQLVDKQYGAFSEHQTQAFTSCTVCNRKFRYAIEFILHFTSSLKCEEEVMSDFGKGSTSFLAALNAWVR